MTTARATYFTVCAGVALWCAALVAAPFLVAYPGVVSMTGRFLYSFFHPLCHQLADRSCHIFGEPLAVCSRCASVYFSFLAGTVFYPLLCNIGRPVFPPRILLLAAVLPIVIDIGTGILGIHEVTNATRMLSGAVFGVVAPYFILPAAIEAMQQVFGDVAPCRDIQTGKGLPHA